MKKIIALLSALAVLMALTACSQNQTPNPTDDTGENPTTESTEPTTQPSTEKPTEGNAEDPVYKYDENGNVIEIIDIQGGTRQVYEYDDRSNVLEDIEYINGEEYSRWSYQYNDADQETLKVYYEYRKEKSRWTYDYHGDGKLAEWVYYEYGQELWREIYPQEGGIIKVTHPQEHEECWEVFNANEDLTEVTFYWDGEETYRTVYNYNEKGWLVEEIDYEKGEEIQRCHRYYDDNGAQIRIRYTLPIQPVHSAVETTFNKVRLEYSGGKLVKETHYEDGVLAKEISYDAAGNLTLEIFYEDGKEICRYLNEYDTNGNCIRTVIFGVEETYTVENEYDASGNLIKSVKTDDHEEITLYTYDEHGTLLGYTITSNGQVFYSAEYQYEYENGILLYKDWIVNGSLITREFYDAEGRIVEESTGTGSAVYYYYGNVVEKVQESDEAGTVSQFSVYDNSGRLVSESYYQDNQIQVQWTYNAQGRRSQALYYQKDGTVKRHLTVYEVVDQDAKSPVKAQLVTRVDFPALDNSPFSYLFEYDGVGLIREMFDGEDWVETVYGGSFSKPLYADWVDCYTDEKCHRGFTYDAQGRLEQILYVVDGNQHYRTVYTYNAQGNVESETEYWGRQEMARITYAYDAKGNLIEKVAYNEGEESFRYTYQYDAKGNLTREYSTDGEIESLRTCQYDKNGKLILDVYTADGEEICRYQYKYDQKGKLIEECYIAPEIDRVTTYEYDAKGNLTHVYVGDFPEQIHIYNNAGRLTETICYGGSNVAETAHYVYKYDENGMLYEIVLVYGDYQPGSVLITYEVVSTTADQAQELESILDDVLQGL